MTYDEYMEGWVESHRGQEEHEHSVWMWDHNKDLYKSRAKSEEGFHWFICELCGYPESTNGSLPEGKMKESRLCFHCNFWEEKIKGSQKGKYIINQQFLSDGGHRPGGVNNWLGFGGRYWYIEDVVNGGLVITNNMWSGGKIPDRFYSGDTARCIHNHTSEEDLSFLEMIYPDMDVRFRERIKSIREYKKREASSLSSASSYLGVICDRSS